MLHTSAQYSVRSSYSRMFIYVFLFLQALLEKKITQKILTLCLYFSEKLTLPASLRQQSPSLLAWGEKLSGRYMLKRLKGEMRISNPAHSSFPCHFQVSTEDVLGVDMSRLASPPFTYFSLFWRFAPFTSSTFPMFLHVTPCWRMPQKSSVMAWLNKTTTHGSDSASTCSYIVCELRMFFILLNG